MTRSEHILSMIRFRFVNTGLSQGMTPGEANLMAEQVMKNQGLFGLWGKAKVMGTPEGAISTMMESFLRVWKQKLSQNVAFVATSSDDPSWESMRVQMCTEAVESVEEFRNNHYPGHLEYPRYIHEYMVYRIKLEMRQMHGIDAAEMGLDDETIRAMSAMSYEYHQQRV